MDGYSDHGAYDNGVFGPAPAPAIRVGQDVGALIFARRAGGALPRALSDLLSDTPSVRDYGVRADGITVTDAAMSASSSVLKSSSHIFTHADIGKLVSVVGAAASGGVLNGRISNVSAGMAILSVAAATAVTGASATFGTDDTAAWNTAVTMGRALYLPPGISCVSASITWRSGVSLRGSGSSVSTIKWMSAGDMAGAVISGLSGSAAAPYTDCQFLDFGIDCTAATQATYNVAGKAIYMQYMVNPVFSRLFLQGSPATGLGCDFMIRGQVSDNVVVNCGRLNTGTQYGGAGIGIGVNGMTGETYNVHGNIVTGAGRFGIFFETQTSQADYTGFAHCHGNYVELMRPAGAVNGSGIADSGIYHFHCHDNYVNCNQYVANCIGVNAGSLGYAGRIGDIVGNTCLGGAQNIALAFNYLAQADMGVVAYRVRGNRVEGASDTGIFVKLPASGTISGVDISENWIRSCQSAAIQFSANSASTGILQYTRLSANIMENCCLNTAEEAGAQWHAAIINVQAYVNLDGFQLYGNYAYNTTLPTAATAGAAYFLNNAGTITDGRAINNAWRNLFVGGTTGSGTTTWSYSDGLPVAQTGGGGK